MKAEGYIVAVKRELRDVAPPDWQDRLREIEGVRVVGGNPKRLHIEATAETIKVVRDRFSSLCHIEPIIIHTLRTL
jgi:coproporphyrinogen III oxidase-like Fe-S oxidoreductase